MTSVFISIKKGAVVLSDRNMFSELESELNNPNGVIFWRHPSESDRVSLHKAKGILKEYGYNAILKEDVFQEKKYIKNSLKISKGYTAPFSRLYATSIEVEQAFTTRLKKSININGSLGHTSVKFTLFKLEGKDLVHIPLEGHEIGNVINIDSKESDILEQGFYVLVKQGVKNWSGSDSINYNELYSFKVGDKNTNFIKAYNCLASC